MRPLGIIKHSAANAFADMRVIYTWQTWLFGWLGRMLAQVTFFTCLGKQVGGDATTFLVIGNSVMTSTIECMSVVASSMWERKAGTLPLLAAAPAHLAWVFFGRSVQWLISGSATSLVALFALGPVFGVRFHPYQIVPVAVLVLLNALGTYCFGLFLAAVFLNTPGLRNVISNSAYLVMMAICGVQVPVDHWPRAVGLVADALPLTHALSAIRTILGDGEVSDAVPAAAVAVLCGVFWFAAAYFAFRASMSRSRRSGGLERS
ncbi:ABC transporter permease [Amycolatopsis sp. NPDC054798]